MADSESPSFDHAGLEILTVEQCQRLLEAAKVGRIGFVDRGEPVIFPIRMGMLGRSVVFTTGPGSKLTAAIMNRPVAVEIDSWDTENQVGWSVLVKGTATTMEGDETDGLDGLGVVAWIRPEDPKDWVRVLPNEITGRRIPDHPPVG